jgi:hypothetical protein
MTHAMYTTRSGNTVALVTRDRAYNEWMLDASYAGDLDDYIDEFFTA